MLRELLSLTCEPLLADEAKDISLKISVMYNEKLKATKEKKKRESNNNKHLLGSG